MKSNNKYSCYTMGHSDLPVEAYIYFIKKARINAVVDVRSTPYSKYQAQFNQEEISKKLNQENIKYIYMGDVLGGRYSSPEFLFPDGTVNYQLVSNSQKFREGLEKLIHLIHDGNMISLMCSEKDPLRCHRFVLIAKNLQETGIEVIHLYPELVRKSHIELEKELLNRNEFSNQNQLFNNQPLFSDEVDELAIAYELLNKKIGYKQQQKIERCNEQKFDFLESNLHHHNKFDINDQKEKKRNKQQTLF